MHRRIILTILIALLAVLPIFSEEMIWSQTSDKALNLDLSQTTNKNSYDENYYIATIGSLSTSAVTELSIMCNYVDPIKEYIMKSASNPSYYRTITLYARVRAVKTNGSVESYSIPISDGRKSADFYIHSVGQPEILTDLFPAVSGNYKYYYIDFFIALGSPTSRYAEFKDYEHIGNANDYQCIFTFTVKTENGYTKTMYVPLLGYYGTSAEDNPASCFFNLDNNGTVINMRGLTYAEPVEVGSLSFLTSSMTSSQADSYSYRIKVEPKAGDDDFVMRKRYTGTAPLYDSTNSLPIRVYLEGTSVTTGSNTSLLSWDSDEDLGNDIIISKNKQDNTSSDVENVANVDETVTFEYNADIKVGLKKNSNVDLDELVSGRYSCDVYFTVSAEW